MPLLNAQSPYGSFACDDRYPEVIGPDDKRWDRVFIAHYPTAAAFLGMLSDPEYKAAVVNRTAAVETSRLIRLDPAPKHTDRFA